MTVLAFDLGSSITRTGTANLEDNGRTQVSIVGKPRRRFQKYYISANSLYVGNDVLAHIDGLSLSNPICNGHIKDKMDVEELLSHSFMDLQSYLTKQSIRGNENYWSDKDLIVNVPCDVERSYIDYISEQLFELLNFNRVSYVTSGLLSVIGQGYTTGLSLEIGHGVTQCVPVLEGTRLLGSTRLDLGGGEMTLFLQRLLCDAGHNLTKRSELRIVEQIKKQFCKAQTSPNEAKNIIYTLPDGQVLENGQNQIKLVDEHLKAAEIFFHPHLTGMELESKSIPDTIKECLSACEMENRKPLYNNICISGGSSLLTGFADRLRQEMKNHFTQAQMDALKINSSNQNRYNASWIGAKILAADSASDTLPWNDKTIYQEKGSRLYSRIV